MIFDWILVGDVRQDESGWVRVMVVEDEFEYLESTSQCQGKVMRERATAAWDRAGGNIYRCRQLASEGCMEHVMSP